MRNFERRFCWVGFFVFRFVRVVDDDDGCADQAEIWLTLRGLTHMWIGNRMVIYDISYVK